MTDFLPAFTDEDINSNLNVLGKASRSIYWGELKRAYAHINFIEEENRIIKESATILFNERNRDGERLVELEAVQTALIGRMAKDKESIEELSAALDFEKGVSKLHAEEKIELAKQITDKDAQLKVALIALRQINTYTEEGDYIGSPYLIAGDALKQIGAVDV